MNGTIPLRKEIRVAVRAKQREGWTSQQTPEQAKEGMVVMGSIKGCQMLKRRRERLGLSRWLTGSNEINSMRKVWYRKSWNMYPLRRRYIRKPRLSFTVNQFEQQGLQAKHIRRDIVVQ